jgi:hypothetical protein
VAVLSLIILAASASSSCHGISSSNTNALRFKQAVAPAKNMGVQYQTLVNEGDLIVGGNEKLTIEDCEYQLIGNIIVKDDAALTIKNAIFNQTTDQYLPENVSADIPANIVVENRASLFLINTTLMIPQNATSRILVQNEAKIYIADSSIENFRYDVSIWAIDRSLLYIENSIMRRAKEDVGYWTVEARTVVCNDYSEVHVENSTFDRAAVYLSSRVFIERSHLKDAVRIFDSPTVQVTGSIIDGYVTAEGSPILYIRSSIIGYGNSTTEPYISASKSTTSADIWLIHMNVETVIAGGSSKVRLIDASVKDLHMYDNAALFVGWDLPLFGPVAFPSELAFIIQLIALNLLAVTIIVVIFVVLRKLRRRRLNEPESLSPASKTKIFNKKIMRMLPNKIR